MTTDSKHLWPEHPQCKRGRIQSRSWDDVVEAWTDWRSAPNERVRRLHSGYSNGGFANDLIRRVLEEGEVVTTHVDGTQREFRKVQDS
jgi:hypothetical protein